MRTILFGYRTDNRNTLPIVFDIWVLRFRVLGASLSRFGFLVFDIWVLRALVFVFEYFFFETTEMFMKIGPAGVPLSKFVISPLSVNLGIDAGHDTLMLPYPPIKLPKPHVTRYLSLWFQYSTS